MRKRDLLLYIRQTQPGITVWEEKQILGRVQTCSIVIKNKISELIEGREDSQFGYSLEKESGEVITLTIEKLINDFGLPHLQAFLFLDWIGKEPLNALSFLQHHDNLLSLPQDNTEDNKHDEVGLTENL